MLNSYKTERNPRTYRFSFKFMSCYVQNENKNLSVFQHCKFLCRIERNKKKIGLNELMPLPGGTTIQIICFSINKRILTWIIGFAIKLSSCDGEPNGRKWSSANFAVNSDHPTISHTKTTILNRTNLLTTKISKVINKIHVTLLASFK